MKTLIFGRNSSIGKELQLIFPENAKNIYCSSKDYNLTKSYQVEGALKYHEPDVVINLAAKCGGIFDNVAKPYDYLNENVQIQTNVIEGCRKNNVDRLLCVGSSCAYADVMDPSAYPLKEHHLYEGAPASTNFGYGLAKRLLVSQLETCNTQYKTHYSCLIPSNLYGQFSGTNGKSHFLGILLRKIWEYKNGNLDKIVMNGGSSAYRQMTYISDVVCTIYKWLYSDKTFIANIAAPESYQISEITNIALRATECDAKVQFLDEKMSGQVRKTISSKLLLSIFPHTYFTPLADGIEDCYAKMKKNWEKE